MIAMDDTRAVSDVMHDTYEVWTNAQLDVSFSLSRVAYSQARAAKIIGEIAVAAEADEFTSIFKGPDMYTVTDIDNVTRLLLWQSPMLGTLELSWYDAKGELQSQESVSVTETTTDARLRDHVLAGWATHTGSQVSDWTRTTLYPWTFTTADALAEATAPSSDATCASSSSASSAATPIAAVAAVAACANDIASEVADAARANLLLSFRHSDMCPQCVVPLAFLKAESSCRIWSPTQDDANKTKRTTEESSAATSSAAATSSL